MLEQHLADFAVPVDGNRYISVGGDFDILRDKGHSAVEAVEEQILIFGKVFAVIIFTKETDEGVCLAVKGGDGIIVFDYDFAGVERYEGLERDNVIFEEGSV